MIFMKEVVAYLKFKKSFQFNYATTINLPDDAECLYRRSFVNERNRLLVKYCSENNLDKIKQWYENSDSDKIYFDEYFENRMSMRVIFKHISKNFTKDNYILDVACGHGAIDIKLSDIGYKVNCIDLNPNRITAIKKKVYKAECTDVESLKDLQIYNIIIALEMLEHVPDVRKTLEKMRELLIENGWLYLSVPNEYKIDDEQHVRIFDKDSLVALLNKSGFIVKAVLPMAYLNDENDNDLVCVCQKK